MRIIFFGTGKFGIPALKKLFVSGHEVVAVVSQPDKRKGRGMNVHPTEIKAVAEMVSPGMEILQPEKTSDPSFLGHVEKKEADVFVVIDYGRILDEAVLGLPKKYCINLHPSLLPKYRGASPVNWAMLNGEKETGNTVIRMNERMDAGDIITQERTDIGAEENAEELSLRLSQSGAELVVKTLDLIAENEESFIGQDEKEVSYAPMLRKEQGKIDWSRPADEIIRKVKGMQPWPGAFTLLEDRLLKIQKAAMAEVAGEGGSPGEVIDEKEFVVSAGESAVRVLELQLQGKRAMRTDEFLRGHRLKKGDNLK